MDAEADPGRAALIQERLSQSLWSQHRQDESLEALRDGLALLPDEPSAERAKLLAQFSRRRMVQSRFAEAAESAREALSVARAVGYREAEAIALNALGTALGESGEVDAGVAYLRESLEIAREEGLEMEEGGAWINISDVLNLAGRTDEALEAALQGLETAFTQDWRTTDWLQLSISEFSFHLGDWDERGGGDPARRAGGTPAARSCTGRRAGRSSRSGAATWTLAEEAIATLARPRPDLTEPQFVGLHGILSAELSRRRGDIDARARRDRRRARPDRVLLRGRGPDRGARRDGPARGGRRRRARARPPRRGGRGGSRGRAPTPCSSARGWRPRRGLVVEAAQLATVRGRVRTGDRQRGAGLWGAAAERWEELGRPYLAAYARWREAEALMAGARPRGRVARGVGRAGRARAGSAARGWPRRWSRWPRGRGSSSARARRGSGRRSDGRRRTTPSASPRASATCSRSWRPAPRTARSASGCTWPRRPPACTCRGSSRS